MKVSSLILFLPNKLRPCMPVIYMNWGTEVSVGFYGPKDNSRDMTKTNQSLFPKLNGKL